MSDIAWVLVLLLVWLVAGLGAALAIGRVARRGDEEMRFFGSWRASQTGEVPPRRADHRSDDRDG